MRRKGSRFRNRTSQAMVSVLPNLLTLSNAACGFGAIVFISDASSTGPAESALASVFAQGSLQYGCWLILAAMVFDALDGSVARMTRSTSSLGSHLDSLSDAVTFTVAPAFLVWKVVSLLPSEMLYIPSRIAWILALLYLVCGLLRLARFNVETTPEPGNHEFFSGLPTPAAAGAVASMTLLSADVSMQSRLSIEWLPRTIFLMVPFIAFMLGVLMVSRIRYPHVIKRAVRGRRPFAYLVQVVFAIAVFALMPFLSISLTAVFLLYAVSGPITALWRRAPAPQQPVADPVQNKVDGA